MPLSESSKEQDSQDFYSLRKRLHIIMEEEVNTRLELGNWQPTDVELDLDAYLEELEPQVRDAVLILNQKGYSTLSSGFYGKHAEYQSIDGFFTIDEETVQKFHALGAIVEPYEEVPGYTFIKFWPKTAELASIKAMWDSIVEVLPFKSSV